MAKVAFSLVMPERELVSTEADMVIVPGGEGDFGVLPGHIPMISTVRPGVVEVRNGSAAERFMVAGGFAEVTRERCTVLAEEAQPFEEVSAEQLAQRLHNAQAAVAEASPTARPAAEKAVTVAQDLQRAYAYYAGR